uniref:Uncharacterized protein n=1 Tax=Timema genevievae TaxID=629358 RepID=A0A7R9PPP8_TIMGE|nr:unnamed protein product [Timema genevievae]
MVKSSSIKQRLLAERQLDYEKAVLISTSLEAAEKDTASLAFGHNTGGTADRHSQILQMSKKEARKDCVDHWSPKVLNSGTGFHFCPRRYKNIMPGIYHNYINENSYIFLADNNVDIEQEKQSADDSSESKSENKSRIYNKDHGSDNIVLI